MEKTVRVMYAVKKITEGENVSYSEIAQFNTFNNVQWLKGKPNFTELISCSFQCKSLECYKACLDDKTAVKKNDNIYRP
jgi:hypothetical protein